MNTNICQIKKLQICIGNNSVSYIKEKKVLFFFISFENEQREYEIMMVYNTLRGLLITVESNSNSI
jgi:hypothetical protein